MATVYQAYDLRHDRDVAVKVLGREVSGVVGRDRFVREIRMAARLTHPHILPVHDSGEANGFLFFVMPVMAGKTLRELLHEQTQLAVDVALRLGTEVADALDYAHRHDFVHRDIKPENILLHEGHAVVADFGVGKALVAATADTEAAMTQIGMVIGTPAYMSPEQATGDVVDGRSDLFALGCVLFEMLTGKAPFAAGTAQATLARRLTETAHAVSALRPSVPAHVSGLVARLLDKRPERRPSSGAEVVMALRAGGTERAAVRSPAASVAVLPFANLSADPDNEFFSDGMTDDVIAALTAVRGLKVAARTSSFAFKGKSAELAAVGATLGVSSVVQGSVRRAGNRVRVTVQLMDAAEGVQLWSDRYDRDLDDIFAVQDEIAARITERLQATLGLPLSATEQTARRTEDLEAYQLYLRGCEAAHQRSRTSLKRAIDCFEQTLVRDPGYARAHAGLAEAYIGLGVFQYIPAIDAAREATAALTVAERLQPELALVHVLWGQLKLYLRADWASARADLDRALDLAPHDARALAYSAHLHAQLGEYEVAKDTSARAVAADPLSTFIRAVSVMGYPFGADGIAGCDSAAALAAHESALAIDPNSMLNLQFAGIRFGDLGRHPEAVAALDRVVQLTQRGPLPLGLYGRALAMAGRTAEALAIRDELRSRAATEYVGPGALLMLLRLDLGDEAAAAALLQANVDAATGPLTLVTTVRSELDELVDHLTLGPIVRRLSHLAGLPATSSGGLPPSGDNSTASAGRG